MAKNVLMSTNPISRPAALLLVPLAAACVALALLYPSADAGPSSSAVPAPMTTTPPNEARSVPMAVEDRVAPSADGGPGPTRIQGDRVLATPKERVVLMAGLSGDEKDALDYMNRILRRNGLEEIPPTASVLEGDWVRALSAIREARDSTEQASMEWRVAGTRRTAEKVAEIESALKEGRSPACETLPLGAPLPTVDGEFDLISVHLPAGSSNRYVIRLPSTEFGAEVERLRVARESSVTLFDETLRRLFTEK